MFCESLREHAMEMINFKKKKINLSTKEHQESYENAKICYICKDKYEGKYAKDKKTYRKNRGRCHYTGEYRGAAYTVPKKVPVDPHKVSYYDYHFIIKVLAEEFEKQFTCLQENTEK